MKENDESRKYEYIVYFLIVFAIVGFVFIFLSSFKYVNILIEGDEKQPEPVYPEADKMLVGYEEECLEYKQVEKYKIKETEEKCEKIYYDDIDYIYYEDIYHYRCSDVPSKAYLEFYNETICIKQHLVKHALGVVLE